MSLCLSYPPAWLPGAVRGPGRVVGAREHGGAERMTEDVIERNLTDSGLLERMANGDKAALAELYDRFSKPLYSMAIQVLREPSEAQDVVHDAFIALWEKASDFKGSRGTAFSWAVTLTRNRAIDRLRQLRRRAELLEESAADAERIHAGGGSTHADESAAQSDEAVHVRDAVKALPTDQRLALELAFYKGLTQQEIAETLQQPLGTVKARIRRGLIKLRESLARRL